ncbi:MAG: hypothetical protein ACR5K3_01970 [Wolbachia sp.]
MKKIGLLVSFQRVTLEFRRKRSMDPNGLCCIASYATKPTGMLL